MASRALIAGVTDAASKGPRIMPNESTTRTAVVVGATGIIGRAIAAKLAGLGGWRVLGLTRSGGTVPGVDEAIAVDLRDSEEARRRLAPAAGATHLFFAAYLPQASWAAEVGPNLALLVNAVEGLEAVGAPLQHVTLITGAKYYGVHLGSSQAPAAETEPRHVGPNFMPELAPLWRNMAAKYGLAQPELGWLVNWGFLEFIFAIEYDIVLAMGKIRRAGFTRHPDTLEGFLKRFDEYRRARIIPTFEPRARATG